MFSSWVHKQDSVLPGITLFPIVLQEPIQPATDVRAVVIDQTVVSATIEVRTREPEGVRDWRSVPLEQVSIRRIELPDPVSRALVSLTRDLKLRFCAYDLMRDVDDRYWFLEGNPGGQFQFLGDDLALDVTDALIRSLTRDPVCQ
jgi:hypothetical protein